MTDDVVVVGGGLEGYLAGLTVARERPDASVRVVDPDPGRFRRESGLVDLLGQTPEGDGPVRNPLTAIADLPADHPYRVAGIDHVRSALALFDDVTGDRYVGDHTEENALVVTPTGAVLPAARYPEGMAPGLASDDRKLLLAGFDRVLDFDAYLAGDRLGEAVPFDVSGVSVTYPGDVGDYPAETRIARALDENRETDDGTPVRTALAEAVRRLLDIEPRVGLPAVLGEVHHAEIREELEETLHADVAEIPLGPPSIPGRRLETMLADALEREGVRLERGNPIVDVEAAGKRVEHVAVQQASERNTREATAFVLATGGLASGGLTSDRDGIREPLFGCHVDHPDERSAWSSPTLLGDQPFARFGLGVDEQFRPVTARDTEHFENLRAAGQVIGGANAPAEKSRGGIAAVTGYAAGLLTAESL